jgi:hypothetical protein
MASEATEERPSSVPPIRRENGPTEAEATNATFGGLEATRLAERIEELERQQREQRRDSLLVTGLAIVAAALAVSMLLQKSFAPPTESGPIVSPRTVSAQSFLLTDPQGHPRAKLTFE